MSSSFALIHFFSSLTYFYHGLLMAFEGYRFWVGDVMNLSLRDTFKVLNHCGIKGVISKIQLYFCIFILYNRLSAIKLAMAYCTLSFSSTHADCWIAVIWGQSWIFRLVSTYLDNISLFLLLLTQPWRKKSSIRIRRHTHVPLHHWLALSLPSFIYLRFELSSIFRWYFPASWGIQWWNPLVIRTLFIGIHLVSVVRSLLLLLHWLLDLIGKVPLIWYELIRVVVYLRV